LKNRPIARLTGVARLLGRSLSDKDVYPKVIDDIKAHTPPGSTGFFMACDKQSEPQTRRIRRGDMCRTDLRNCQMLLSRRDEQAVYVDDRAGI